MLEIVRPSVASTEYISVFSVHRQSGAFVNTSTKFWNRNGWGQRWGESAWLLVIRDVRRMKRNGRMKAIAKPISTAWFATVPSVWRRRPGAQGRPRRRVIGAAAAVTWLRLPG